MALSGRRSIGTGVAAFLSVLMLVVGANGQVRFVDDDAAPGGDGLAWGTAYKYLQDALAEAAGAGGAITEIRVGQGTYRPDEDEANPAGTGNRSATFTMLSGLSVLGGHDGIGAVDPDFRDPTLLVTILTGDLLGDDGPDFLNYAENSFHVVTTSGVDATAMIDGCTITAGHGENFSGAGIFNDGGDLTISGCSITLHRTLGQGAGLYNINGANPTIVDCQFIGNTGRSDGVAMFNDETAHLTITGCEFVGNLGNMQGILRAIIGTRLSSIRFDSCSFMDNVGARVISIGGPILAIDNCIFDSNANDFAVNAGGAIVTVMKSQFLNNAGGAITGGGSLDVSGSTFQNNGFVSGVSPASNGGAINVGGGGGT